MSQLGDTLSEERRRQGKSLVDVEAGTRIRARLLEALEHGDYDMLPAPAYVKGYIQSYAKYLDIPSQPLLELYKVDVRFTDERDADRSQPLMPRGARYSKVSRQNLEDLPADPVVPRRDQAHAIPTRTWLIAGAGILAAFLVLWGVSKLVTGKPDTPPVPNSAVQETTVAPTTDASSSSTVASTPVTPVAPVTTSDGSTSDTAASTAATANVTPFKLTFRIRPGETSRLKVTVDGNVAFDSSVSSTAEMPSLDVYQKAVIVIGSPRWVTTFQDGVRHPTPNQDTAYTFTLTNPNASQ